jgi:hypothetical protein
VSAPHLRLPTARPTCDETERQLATNNTRRTEPTRRLSAKQQIVQGDADAIGNLYQTVRAAIKYRTVLQQIVAMDRNSHEDAVQTIVYLAWAFLAGVIGSVEVDRELGIASRATNRRGPRRRQRLTNRGSSERAILKVVRLLTRRYVDHQRHAARREKTACEKGEQVAGDEEKPYQCYLPKLS